MQYILTAGWDDGIAALTERLVRDLTAGRHVLWLMSGGSNIPASVQIMKSIPAKLSENLTIMLADERYGPPGHADSNWAQLKAAGLDTKHAEVLEVLRPDLSFEQARERFNLLATEAMSGNVTVIAQLGVGDDGHLAGIIPGTEPSQDKTTDLAASLVVPPYQRVTLTFAALRHVTAAYVFSFGKPKHDALASLQSDKLPLSQQPAQILKELPEAYVYNDQLGDSA